MKRLAWLSLVGVAATASVTAITGASPPTLLQDGAAAANVLRAYYSALNARDFPKAYALWNGRGAASGKSFGDFSHGFAQTRSTSVTIVRVGQPEGAAGSLITTVSVRVDATLKSGERQHFVGDYVLRRTNDVPGSTAEQRAWHIQSADLRPAGP